MTLETFVFLCSSLLGVAAMVSGLFAKIEFDREHAARLQTIAAIRARQEDM
jgi:hypothetical protein